MPSPAIQPVTDPDGVRWNACAWFGGQAGGTAWMVTAFATYVRQSPWLGSLFLVAFVGLNALGFWLWRQRSRFRFFRSVQLMIAASAALALLAVAGFDFLRPPDLKRDLGSEGRWVGASRAEYRSAYVLLLVLIPAMLIQFEIQARLARRRGGSGA